MFETGLRDDVTAFITHVDADRVLAVIARRTHRVKQIDRVNARKFRSFEFQPQRIRPHLAVFEDIEEKAWHRIIPTIGRMAITDRSIYRNCVTRQ